MFLFASQWLSFEGFCLRSVIDMALLCLFYDTCIVLALRLFIFFATYLVESLEDFVLKGIIETSIFLLAYSSLVYSDKISIKGSRLGDNGVLISLIQQLKMAIWLVIDIGIVL